MKLSNFEKNPKEWIKDSVISLENYLEYVHFDEFPTLRDDDLRDHYNDWVATLSRQELMKYAKEMTDDWARWTVDEYQLKSQQHTKNCATRSQNHSHSTTSAHS